MTSIARNGVGGLILRATTIALAAILFGCSPKPAPVDAATPAAASQTSPAPAKPEQ